MGKKGSGFEVKGNGPSPANGNFRRIAGSPCPTAFPPSMCLSAKWEQSLFSAEDMTLPFSSFPPSLGENNVLGSSEQEIKVPIYSGVPTPMPPPLPPANHELSFQGELYQITEIKILHDPKLLSAKPKSS